MDGCMHACIHRGCYYTKSTSVCREYYYTYYTCYATEDVYQLLHILLHYYACVYTLCIILCVDAYREQEMDGIMSAWIHGYQDGVHGQYHVQEYAQSIMQSMQQHKGVPLLQREYYTQEYTAHHHHTTAYRDVCIYVYNRMQEGWRDVCMDTLTHTPGYQLVEGCSALLIRSPLHTLPLHTLHTCCYAAMLPCILGSPSYYCQYYYYTYTLLLMEGCLLFTDARTHQHRWMDVGMQGWYQGCYVYSATNAMLP